MNFSKTSSDLDKLSAKIFVMNWREFKAWLSINFAKTCAARGNVDLLDAISRKNLNLCKLIYIVFNGTCSLGRDPITIDIFDFISSLN